MESSSESEVLLLGVENSESGVETSASDSGVVGVEVSDGEFCLAAAFLEWER